MRTCNGDSMKLVSVIGTRPQLVKLAAIESARLKMQKNGLDIENIIVNTGQHFDYNMNDIFFSQLSIPKPNYFLDVNKMNHGAMTGRMMEKIETILIEENPDWVLVFGDTNSTLAGALTARKLNLNVAHIEAGLRSYKNTMPEEINRVLADRLSDILFCPTQNACSNLMKEGYGNLQVEICYSGDVMYDIFKYFKSLCQIKNRNQTYIVATVHRAENTDNSDNLTQIFQALSRIAQSKMIIIPLHPRTRAIVEKNAGLKKLSHNLEIIEPQGYLDMMNLLAGCELVITDSGGLQKEAFFSGKMSLITRNETEWTELVESGYAYLCGAEADQICNHYQMAASCQPDFTREIYGDGNAAGKILQILLDRYT